MSVSHLCKWFLQLLIIWDEAEGRVHGALNKSKSWKTGSTCPLWVYGLKHRADSYGHNGFPGFIILLYVFFTACCYGIIPQNFLLAKKLLDHVPFSIRSGFPKKPLWRLSWQAQESLCSHKPMCIAHVSTASISSFCGTQKNPKIKISIRTLVDVNSSSLLHCSD